MEEEIVFTKKTAAAKPPIHGMANRKTASVPSVPSHPAGFFCP
jgi:hypothetical protein